MDLRVEGARHSLLNGLEPAGVRKQLRTSQAVAIVDRIDVDSPIAHAKLELARSLITDHGPSTRNAARSSVRRGAVMRLRLRAPASEA
jgi:hypothetical protein